MHLAQRIARGKSRTPYLPPSPFFLFLFLLFLYFEARREPKAWTHSDVFPFGFTIPPRLRTLLYILKKEAEVGRTEKVKTFSRLLETRRGIRAFWTDFDESR